jgi:putative thiamine transport system ATP-binding protein
MTLALKDLALHLNGEAMIRPFSLHVAKGEIVTIMGRSGSGKSSLLAAIGGGLADAITVTGEAALNGTSLFSLPPERRKMGRLFQDDLLFPHMTVGENLLFATPAGTRATRNAKVATALAQADLAGFEARAPHTLSGGQRQRVALMRSFLAEPHAILLDEPFSKLDAALRQDMRNFVFTHIRTRNIPALMVTHDATDAPADGRILTINEGALTHA